MVHVEIKDLYQNKYTLLWSVLSFQAGLLNASGFLIAGSYVSHVTGFGTQVGLAVGNQEFRFGIELFVIPLSFIGGSLLASLILDKDYSPNKIPNYPSVQLLITLLLGCIVLLFSLKMFQEKSPLVHDEKSVFLSGLLCLVCGLKNGLTTWATHGKIRTTHLTGLSTDIGLNIPKLFKKPDSSSRYPEPKKITYVRIFTLLSFSVGSAMAAILIPVIKYRIFSIVFVISVGLFIVSFIHRRKFQATAINEKLIGLIYANIN